VDHSSDGMSENRVLKLKGTVEKFPMGKALFSYLLARAAPYFKTIRPQVVELQPNVIKVSMNQRRSVENHLGTIHAIATCNLCEFAAGICMEASIPAHRRWIPTGMTVTYLHKAKSHLTATCDLSFVDWEVCEEVVCPVTVIDVNDVAVVQALITMKVSNRKK